MGRCGGGLSVGVLWATVRCGFNAEGCMGELGVMWEIWNRESEFCEGDGGGYEVAGFKRGCAMDNGAMWV